MRVAFLESFYAGSHRSVADGWRAHSTHDIDLLTLPGRHWKWRMHGGAWQLMRKLTERATRPDVLFVTSLIDAAGLRGMLPVGWRDIPMVLYMHENQFAYPSHGEEDYRYGFLNLSSATSADQIWFNSAWNRDSFLAGAKNFLTMMPDRVGGMLEGLQQKSSIAYPGVDVPVLPAERSGPLRILWSHRWEYDKRPDRFFEVLQNIRDLPFRLLLLGESYATNPHAKVLIEEEFADRIEVAGYVSREEYWRHLHRADVVFSAADHEFYGLSVVEAMVSGAMPLLPQRLSYPELVAPAEGRLYSELPEAVETLRHWCMHPEHLRNRPRVVADAFLWTTIAPQWDKRLASADNSGIEIVE